MPIAHYSGVRACVDTTLIVFSGRAQCATAMLWALLKTKTLCQNNNKKSVNWSSERVWRIVGTSVFTTSPKCCCRRWSQATDACGTFLLVCRRQILLFALCLASHTAQVVRYILHICEISHSMRLAGNAPRRKSLFIYLFHHVNLLILLFSCLPACKRMCMNYINGRDVGRKVRKWNKIKP